MDISLKKASNYQHIYQKHDLTLFSKILSDRILLYYNFYIEVVMQIKILKNRSRLKKFKRYIDCLGERNV